MKKRIASYFDTVLGGIHSIESFHPELPLFLNRYAFSRTKVLGHPLVLAFVENDEQTPMEYQSVSEKLRIELGEPVAFVFESLPTNKRNALLRYHVPFVIPGRQFFLPPLMELREHEAKRVVVRERLHFPAQAVVLRELTVGDVAMHSLKRLGDILGFSAMSMTTAANELNAVGLADIVEGMPRHIVFASQGRELWKAACPHLGSPVKKRLFLVEDRKNLVTAGISALAERSMLNPDRRVVRAVGETGYKTLLPLKTVETVDEASAVLEVWGYDPLRIGGKGVDDFSLWLSLQPDAAVDPRVEGELESLMEQRKWQ